MRFAEIGQQLRAYRLESGLRAEEIAARLGVSRAALYRYEKGEVIKLDKRTYASALHEQKLDEDRMCVTLLPLAYQTVVFEGGKSHALAPPALLNVEAFWPLTADPGREGEQPPAATTGLAVREN